ncbi:MAG: hypothetical protein FWG87_08065 [Defluviitaleaceae bacterium]|nr:hypothetical protein [Defluviitaleaceae bacterium]
MRCCLRKPLRQHLTACLVGISSRAFSRGGIYPSRGTTANRARRVPEIRRAGKPSPTKEPANLGTDKSVPYKNHANSENW